MLVYGGIVLDLVYGASSISPGFGSDALYSIGACKSEMEYIVELLIVRP